MKLVQGDYPGASQFAEFDKNVQAMSLEECRGLLECILHRASPVDEESALIFDYLAIAEQCWKEGR